MKLEKRIFVAADLSYYLSDVAFKNNIIKRWSEAESFTIFENHVYSHLKNLIFARKCVNLALKLIAACT